MKNFNEYNLNLAKSIDEKMFFVKELKLEEYDLIVDFGCATGELIKRLDYIGLKTLNNKVNLIGYDLSKEMIEEAQKSSVSNNVIFTSDWEEIFEKVETGRYKKTMIIFSSVLHEIEEQAQKEVIESIMPMFDTIVIRDMKRPLNNEPISNETRKRCLKQVASWQAEIFEEKWGKITDKENLYRFFLMNEFVENFETEVEEDYFSVMWSEIEWYLKGKGYETKYVQSYTLPYRKKQVSKRFNHDMQDITHRKVIYDRKNAEN